MSTNKKPLTWQGSKTPLLPHLHPLILAQPHQTFVEVFAGSAVVTLTLPRRKNVVEVINDLNGELVNFHRCMIHHAPEMIRLMRWQINSRELFIQARQSTQGTEIQRACRFWFLNIVSFGANMHSFGVTRKNGYAGTGGMICRWLPRLPLLRQASRRMQGVAVENLDWQRCLKLYDHPGALFFLDPPYVGTVQDTYKSFTIADMTLLRDTVLNLKGRWIVTVGDTPQMREMWQGCQITSVSRARGINNAARKSYSELIITPTA